LGKFVGDVASLSWVWIVSVNGVGVNFTKRKIKKNVERP
jgi:hypothetical protein